MCTPARSSLFEQIIAVMYISIVQKANAQEFLTADLLTSYPMLRGILIHYLQSHCADLHIYNSKYQIMIINTIILGYILSCKPFRILVLVFDNLIAKVLQYAQSKLIPA